MAGNSHYPFKSLAHKVAHLSIPAILLAVNVFLAWKLWTTQVAIRCKDLVLGSGPGWLFVAGSTATCCGVLWVMWFYNKPNDALNDALNGARGIVIGILVSLPFWVLIALGLVASC